MAALTILACQIHVPPVATGVERDRHLDRVAAEIRSHLRQRPYDLIVLPELSSIDYSVASFDNLDALAEPLDGPSLQRFGSLAREFGVTVVYGIPRRGDDAYFISQVIVDGSGAPLGYFDKLHLAQYGTSMEKNYFERGEHIFVFELRGMRIAPIICYDIRIPELTRTLAIEQGVQLVLHCSAHARDESFYSWHHFSVCRAVENQIYFLSLNRAGKNYGNSIFCTPWVDQNSPGIRFPKTAEKFETIEIETDLIDNIRKEYSLLQDRLGDYSTLPNLSDDPSIEDYRKRRKLFGLSGMQTAQVD